MMRTPIVDFLQAYGESDRLRLHMPGHKGQGAWGFERYDLTEVKGADSLFEAEGIIAESEKNASRLFGCPTFYSTEGSSLCIRAMLFLISQHAKERGESPLILAGRNAHKVFLEGTALLDLEIEWLWGEGSSYLSCPLTAEYLKKIISSMKRRPTAVYLTGPDYLGNDLNWREIAEVCHRHGVLLAVDCAHGAYLRFLKPSRHPMDLGADLCCTSAHKTLPVLTGGAYLHVASHAPSYLLEQAKRGLALFASTSPSYLILQSLDSVNAILNEDYSKDLMRFSEKVAQTKQDLERVGYTFVGNEPLKLTVCTKVYGYLGVEFADRLRDRGIECEFADRDYVVLMLTPAIGEDGLRRLRDQMCAIPRKVPVEEATPAMTRPISVMTVREALLSRSELVATELCKGRVLASASVGCPPAVPIAVCGERIDADVIEAFKYYGITHLWVVKSEIRTVEIC